MFLLTNSQRLSLFEIYDLYPWEYEIYINLLNSYLEEEQQKQQEQILKNSNTP